MNQKETYRQYCKSFMLNDRSFYWQIFLALLEGASAEELKQMPDFPILCQEAIKIAEEGKSLGKNELLNQIVLFTIQTPDLKKIKCLVEDCQFTNLAKMSDQSGTTLLLEACYHGQCEIAEYL